jgi:P4 family phage/plasmid primase-like protien
MGQVNECLQHIATDLNTYTFDELNADENLINFENGLLRLTDLELLPHTPEVLSTIQIPCKWNGYASPTPVFDGYLETLTDGDKEIQDLLFEFIGACLSNIKGWRMKKSLWMVGPGNTGKSVLKTLVEQILGNHNFIGIDLSEIEARFGTGAIYGKRLAGSSDMSFITIKELKTFKKCTGGDSLFAEFKGQSPFQFTYNGLLWFCMNRLPRFGGDDGQWVYDRIMEVICKNIIPLEKQDKTLIDKMYEEREGIVYKAVMAVQGLIQNGYTFTEPESVLIARQNYREQNSTVISFFNECMCPREDGKITDLVTTGKVYKAYRAWCRDNNNGYGKTIREFREELAAHLGREHVDLVKRQKGNSYYADHTLTEEAQRLYLNSYIPEDPEDDFLM